MPRTEQGVCFLRHEIFPALQSFGFVFQSFGRIGGKIHFVRRAVFVREFYFPEIFSDNRGRINKAFERNGFKLRRICRFIFRLVSAVAYCQPFGIFSEPVTLTAVSFAPSG